VPKEWQDWLDQGGYFRPAATPLEKAQEALEGFKREFGPYTPARYRAHEAEAVYKKAHDTVSRYVGSGLGGIGYGSDKISKQSGKDSYEAYTRLNQWALLSQLLENAPAVAQAVDISTLRRLWNPDTGTICITRGVRWSGTPDALLARYQREGMRDVLSFSANERGAMGGTRLTADVPWDQVFVSGTNRQMYGGGSEQEILVRDLRPEQLISVDHNWRSIDDMLNHVVTPGAPPLLG